MRFDVDANFAHIEYTNNDLPDVRRMVNRIVKCLGALDRNSLKKINEVIDMRMKMMVQ